MGEYCREQRMQESRAIAYNGGGCRQLNHFIDNKTCVQKMSVRGTNTMSSLTTGTANKHVKSLAEQAQAAKDGFGDRTFVVNNTALTAPIDANAHDFTEASAIKSDRKVIVANVDIYRYNKTDRTQEGLKKGKDVLLAIDNVSTPCEIGAYKTGNDEIKIDHFKMV